MLTSGLFVVYYDGKNINAVITFYPDVNKFNRHSNKATLVINKCWMHIGTKFTFRYSEIYVVQYYELHIIIISNCKYFIM